MFSKLLIANRGEIALRIIRACRELGVGTVAVYSEADAKSLHVQMADEAVCIGPAPSIESYLKASHLISAAEIAGAEAIHPGYGFLAENASFAEMCERCGITFVGPTAEQISLMGDKVRARETAVAAGVAVVPGSETPLASAEEAAELGARIGYPVMLKASAGGGGKGMRRVSSPADLGQAFGAASAEAMATFGNPALYLERYISSARHVEIQLLGDQHGSVVHLGERDCSIQRRHQKLLEESPSPAMTPDLRARMGKAAVRLARAVDYRGAGTVEFLLDLEGNFYFMEMNTRIQVEHPVTEMVTGIDLLKAQIRVAAGDPLKMTQEDIALRGHSIECRINAEDPDTFVPSPGKILDLRLPGGPGVRVDTHLYAGYTIPPFYDSLMAKLIVLGESRDEAIARMLRALEELVIDGVKSTTPLHKRILSSPEFRAGRVSTRFLESILTGALR
jgi:acetyl-CoA carboxylase biotin carboxylase subunit